MMEFVQVQISKLSPPQHAEQDEALFLITDGYLQRKNDRLNDAYNAYNSTKERR